MHVQLSIFFQYLSNSNKYDAVFMPTSLMLGTPKIRCQTAAYEYFSTSPIWVIYYGLLQIHSTSIYCRISDVTQTHLGLPWHHQMQNVLVWMQILTRCWLIWSPMYSDYHINQVGLPCYVLVSECQLKHLTNFKFVHFLSWNFTAMPLAIWIIYTSSTLHWYVHHVIVCISRMYVQCCDLVDNNARPCPTIALLRWVFLSSNFRTPKMCCVDKEVLWPTHWNNC